MSISINEICQLAYRILRKQGLRKEDTDVIVAHVLDAELAGRSSHGFQRILGILRNTDTSGTRGHKMVLEQENGNSVRVNGGQRLGLVVGQKALETAVDLSQEHGLTAVAGYNYLGNTGMIGYYTRQIAAADRIGIMVSNSPNVIAPWGGTAPLFGTNPISFAFPTLNDPIVIDLSTTKWAYGDILLALKEGRSLPDNIVLDAEGNPSNNPADARGGSMLPFGEHKGYALALAIELLAGPLVGAKAGPKSPLGEMGFLIMTIDPAIFGSLAAFKQKASALVGQIKASPTRPNIDEVFYPGERGQAKRDANLRRGQVDVPDEVIAELRALDN
ncbi:MAG: Ldh family oxidoreductase [Chloroflexota bacterium]